MVLRFFCFQELCQTYLERLHLLLSSNHWHIVSSSYGSKFSGHMGSAIAFRVDKWEMVDCKIKTLGEWQQFDNNSNVQKRNAILTFFSFLWSSLCLLFFAPMISPYKLAAERHNVIICVKLKPLKDSNKKNAFVVSTYHMPCAFQNPPLMTIHAALAAQFVHKFSQNSPYILAGDFNFKPHDPQYKLYLHGKLDETADRHALPPSISQWKVQLPAKLRSAYVEANGSEPPFTNWSQVKNDPVFKDTLDFIFLSDHKRWQVQSVRDLSTITNGPFPNKSEPSDHLLLAATLSLNTSNK